jgi:hypothetical protein
MRWIALCVKYMIARPRKIPRMIHKNLSCSHNVNDCVDSGGFSGGIGYIVDILFV